MEIQSTLIPFSPNWLVSNDPFWFCATLSQFQLGKQKKESMDTQQFIPVKIPALQQKLDLTKKLLSKEYYMIQRTCTLSKALFPGILLHLVASHQKNYKMLNVQLNVKTNNIAKAQLQVTGWWTSRSTRDLLLNQSCCLCIQGNQIKHKMGCKVAPHFYSLQSE